MLVAKDGDDTVANDDLGCFGARGASSVVVAIVENMVHRSCISSDEQLATDGTWEDQMIALVFVVETRDRNAWCFGDVDTVIANDWLAIGRCWILDSELLLGIARITGQERRSLGTRQVEPYRWLC